MKKAGIIIFSILFLISLIAQEQLNIFKTDKTLINKLIANIDSIYFSNGNAQMNIRNTDHTVSSFNVSDIDSVTFEGSNDTIEIKYNEGSVSIINPLTMNGITISVNGAAVVVNSTVLYNEVIYKLSGSSTNGSLKIYSDNRLQLLLDNLTLTNTTGSAINIQSKKRTTITLSAGTSNSLTDGSTYATSTEDQKSTFFSEGQLVFGGSGSLIVKSIAKHAICSDDYILINSGNIAVSGAGKDGIHTNGFFKTTGGTLNIAATGDGIECELGHVFIDGGNITTTNTVADTKGITCDSTMTVSGGTITMTVNGNQAKGLRSKQGMNLNGGSITVITNGAAVLATLGIGYDPSYCTAIKAGTVLNIGGSNITITSTGVGNKGISSDGSINMTSGSVNFTSTGNGATFTNSLGVVDSYSSSAFDADGDIAILGGNITSITSGTGGKGISCDSNLSFGDNASSPIINITNNSERFLVSGTANYTTAKYYEAKGIKCDGILAINNGNFTISASKQGGEGIDCDSIINISGGILEITIAGNQSKGINSTREMNLTGGTIDVKATGGVALENITATTFDPSYCAAIKSDAAINLGGSNVTITSSGIAGKGITSSNSINMTSGTVKITCSNTGTTTPTYKNLSNVNDVYNSSCFVSDKNLSVTGGSLICANSGPGGKGMSADGTITIGSSSSVPTVSITTTGARILVSGTDYCHPKAIVSAGTITIVNGTNTITSTDDGIHSTTSITINGGVNTIRANSTTKGVGEGIESKFIYINGGTNTINASNDGINVSMGTTSGGTESDDNSLLTITGGTTYVTGADAIDSNGDLTMTGGIIFANGPASGAEEYCDINGTANFNGGIFIGCGTAGMQKAPSTTSTQANLFSKGSITAGTLVTLTINGVGVASFKPVNACAATLITTPQMLKGAAYVLYTGGTYTGGTSTNNLYLGGNFSTTDINNQPTTKKSGTLSTTSTLNSITF